MERRYLKKQDILPTTVLWLKKNWHCTNNRGDWLPNKPFLSVSRLLIPNQGFLSNLRFRENESTKTSGKEIQYSFLTIFRGHTREE